jgi:Leucine-rich repeat (LRR) protein
MKNEKSLTSMCLVALIVCWPQFVFGMDLRWHSVDCGKHGRYEPDIFPSDSGRTITDARLLEILDEPAFRWDRPLREGAAFRIGTLLNEWNALYSSIKNSKYKDPEGYYRVKHKIGLHLSGAKITKVPAELCQLQKFGRLYLHGCQYLTDVSNLKELTGLEKIEISFANYLTEFPTLAGLTRLRSLTISSCNNLNKVDLSRRNRLTALTILSCPSLTDIPGLENLINVQNITINYCDGIVGLPDLSGLKCLSELAFCSCKGLRNISGLRGLAHLKTLDLSGCIRVHDVSVLGNLTSLRELRLYSCINLKDIPALRRLEALEVLSLQNTPLVEGIDKSLVNAASMNRDHEAVIALLDAIEARRCGRAKE